MEDTLIVWGGEFGRINYTQGGDGRDHHAKCFTSWMAGGGIKAGATHGATDDFAFNITDGAVHPRDQVTTICDILGIDAHRLSKRVLGVDLKPFGVEPGKVITSAHTLICSRSKKGPENQPKKRAPGSLVGFLAALLVFSCRAARALAASCLARCASRMGTRRLEMMTERRLLVVFKPRSSVGVTRSTRPPSIFWMSWRRKPRTSWQRGQHTPSRRLPRPSTDQSVQ